MKVEINLQLLTWPMLAIAAFYICRAVYTLATTYGREELIAVIGVGLAYRDGLIGVVLLVISWLIWRAFRA